MRNSQSKAGDLWRRVLVLAQSEKKWGHAPLAHVVVSPQRGQWGPDKRLSRRLCPSQESLVPMVNIKDKPLSPKPCNQLGRQSLTSHLVWVPTEILVGCRWQSVKRDQI